jgi:hypothetical protein
MTLKIKVAIAVVAFAVACLAVKAKQRKDEADAAAAMQRQVEADTAKKKQTEADAAAAAKRQAEAAAAKQKAEDEITATCKAKVNIDTEGIGRFLDCVGAETKERQWQSTPHTAAEDNDRECLHGGGSNCSVNNDRMNLITGCQYGYTTDSHNAIQCNSKPVDVRIVP